MGYSNLAIDLILQIRFYRIKGHLMMCRCQKASIPTRVQQVLPGWRYWALRHRLGRGSEIAYSGIDLTLKGSAIGDGNAQMKLTMFSYSLVSEQPP